MIALKIGSPPDIRVLAYTLRSLRPWQLAHDCHFPSKLAEPLQPPSRHRMRVYEPGALASGAWHRRTDRQNRAGLEFQRYRRQAGAGAHGAHHEPRLRIQIASPCTIRALDLNGLGNRSRRYAVLCSKNFSSSATLRSSGPLVILFVYHELTLALFYNRP